MDTFLVCPKTYAELEIKGIFDDRGNAQLIFIKT